MLCTISKAILNGLNAIVLVLPIHLKRISFKALSNPLLHNHPNLWEYLQPGCCRNHFRCVLFSCNLGDRMYVFPAFRTLGSDRLGIRSSDHSRLLHSSTHWFFVHNCCIHIGHLMPRSQMQQPRPSTWFWNPKKQRTTL